MSSLLELARFTDDVDAVTAFYEQVLGDGTARRLDGMCEFDLGGVILRIHELSRARRHALPAEDHIAFGVEDVDRACVEAVGRGLSCVHPPQDFPWGRSAYLRDPDGRLVELHEASSGD